MNIIILSPSFKNKGGVASTAKNFSELCSCKSIAIINIFTQINKNRIIKSLYFLKAIFIFLFHLISKKIHIVHVHVGNINSLKRKLLFITIAELFKIKIIYHHHGGFLLEEFETLGSFYKKYIKKILNKVDLIICLSENLKKKYKSIFPGLNYVVIPNGVFVPMDTPYNRKKNIFFNLSFMGHIYYKKGIFDLLKVTKNLKDKGYNIRLLVAGSGNFEKLNKLIKKYNLNLNVRYLGYISDSKKFKFFSESDLFILPSYTEAMPVVILEAMSYGVPVISTNVGSIPEIIKHGYNGMLFKPGDLEKLEKYIIYFIEDYERLRFIGINGKKCIIQKYNIRLISKKIISIYKTI